MLPFHQSLSVARRSLPVGVCVMLAASLISCGTSAAPKIDEPAPRPIGTPVAITPPLGLPPVPIPAENPPTADTIALGRKLYYEPRVSVDASVSCASCHNPSLGFADGRRFSLGVHGQSGKRSAPTV